MKVEFNNQQYKVFWKHYNHSQDDWNANNGGTTCKIVLLGNQEPLLKGRSLCVKSDQFNKSIGRIISLTKALNGQPKEFRTAFWKQYKNEIGFK